MSVHTLWSTTRSKGGPRYKHYNKQMRDITERLRASTHQSISVEDEITPRSVSEMEEVTYQRG